MNSGLTIEQNQEAKARIRRIFSHLKELSKVRQPCVRDADSYPWILKLDDLPNHPCIVRPVRIVSENDESEIKDEDVILRVRRPKETSCPVPPDCLNGWIRGDWGKFAAEPSYLELKIMNLKALLKLKDLGPLRNEYSLGKIGS